MRKLTAIFVYFLLVSAMLAASAVVFAGKPPDKGGGKGKPGIGTEYRMPTDSWYGADIWGDNTFWIDANEGGTYSIWVFNPGPDGEPLTGDDQIQEVVTSVTPEHLDGFAVWEDKVVFSDGPYVGEGQYNNEIYLVDVGTGQEYQLTNTEQTTEVWCEIYGDVIVYQRGPSGEDPPCVVFHSPGEDDIWGSDDDVTHTRPCHCWPIIWGDKVWVEALREHDPSANPLVYTIDQDGTPTDSTVWTRGQVLSIYDDDFAYTVMDSWDTYGIYVYNMLTDEDTPVATGRKNEYRPKIYGSRVLYSEYELKKGRIIQDAYFYDLQAGEAHALTSTGHGVRVDIWGERILYKDTRGDVAGLYLFILNPGGGGQSAGVRSGIDGFSLLQNTPNPVRDRTAIRFTLAESTPVTVTVHDVAGRTVATVADREFTPGTHSVEWIPDVPSGTYFCRLNAGDNSASLRMTVIR